MCHYTKANAQKLSSPQSASAISIQLSPEERLQVIKEANDSLDQGPWSVINKKMLPASGDPHDYFSVGFYFWPNPNTPNGLPYVEKDGQWNKEGDFDRETFNKMISSVRKLSFGYYITQDERYAERAAYLIQVWFLDEKTRMNPHLRFAQAVPGKNDGRAIGIIDACGLPDVLKSIQLIQKSPAWNSKNHAKLVAWFSSYLDWLLQSDFGHAELAMKNNHGSWYLSQISIYATFTGRSQEVRGILEKSIPLLLQGQIASDGSQPLELKRTRSLHYSIFNLTAWLDIVELAPQIGIRLFEKDSENSKLLLRAVSYLQDQTAPGKTWPYPEINPTPLTNLRPIFLKAAFYLNQPSFEKSAKALPEISNDTRNLFNIISF